MLKKILKIVVVAILIFAIFTVSASAETTTKRYVNDLDDGNARENRFWFGFNDYGWVVVKCVGGCTEEFTINGCNIKRVYRKQWGAVDCSRTDMPGFVPVMTNLAYYGANDNVIRKFNMTRVTDMIYSSSWEKYWERENSDDVTYRRDLPMWSWFQINISAGGSFRGGAVFNCKFKINV